MRSGKELILASKEFTKEDRFKSWKEIIITLLLLIFFFSGSLFPSLLLPFRLLSGLLCALLYVRIFVIYHDYQHHAILQKSMVAKYLMRLVGVYLLTPENIWKRSHDHHHNHNSKLTISGIGSYPTICKHRYLGLTKEQQLLYLVNRHPLTVLLGYFTLFIYWLNVKSFLQSPKKHWDSFLALFLHVTGGFAIFYFFGAASFFITWFVPFLVSFGIGSYLFYSQHNFPLAKFCENHDWKYDNAALTSTSLMTMHPIMEWFTGYIGYHHVHHLNSRIPFYRLKEAMSKMPELNTVAKTSWNPVEMYRCFRLKLWDPEKGKMIRLSQI